MRNARIHFYPILLASALLLICGCAQDESLEQARISAKKSDAYYQGAIDRYNALIKKGADADRLHFELGQLYYSRAELDMAAAELKKSSLPEAKRLLAISYYRMNNFTDALEIFERSDIRDGECLYYYGLTCEKLNLFDKAIKTYEKINDKKYRALALARANVIEKQVGAVHIKDVDPRIYKIIQSSPVQEAYPQAGALILYCDEKIEVSEKDTQVSYLHYCIKILNERGKEGFSEAHIEYDSTYEKVELEYARTIKPDGTVADVGIRHIRDVSKYMNFPLYSNVRVFIISFPEIAEGSVVEYKAKIYRNQLINKKDFIINYPVQSSEPIISANFTIDLPKAKAINIKTLNQDYNNFGADLKPKIRETGERLVYLWEFKDIPQIIPEPNMPAETDVNPAMLISTFGSWEQIYRWWWSLARDKINADEAIKLKVKELISGQDNEEDKIREIYNFCAREIRYVAVEYGEAGYEPHNAADIFKNKYGDCKDQSILLITMLKEAGFTAWPVLISTRGYYNLNPDFPAVFFNHCIAAVILNDMAVFLDPTVQTCSFADLPSSDQDRKVLMFKADTYKIEDTPLYPAGHNFARHELGIKVNSDESISAKKVISTGGVYQQAQRYWLLYTPPQLIEEALKQKAQEVSIGSLLDSYEAKNADNLNEASVLSYVFHGPEYFTAAGNLRILPQLASVDPALVAKDRRRYPIDFGILDLKEIVLEFEIPDNFRIKYIPESLNQESPWVKFSCEYLRRDKKLFFRQNIELKEKMVSVSDYAAFKNFLEGLAKKIKQRVILERLR